MTSDREPDAALARFIFKLRREGANYLWRRLRWEFTNPTTWPGRAAHALALKALAARQFRALARRSGGHHPDAADTLFAFYDLNVAPVTFDVLWFVVAAELRRRALGLARIDFVVVPGKRQGVRTEDPDYERIVDADARRARLLNVVLPAFGLLPAASGMAIAGSRAEAALLARRAAHLYPALYSVALPSMHHPSEVMDAARQGEPVRCLRAPPEAGKHVARWRESRVGNRRLIVITLRHYGYMPARNSNLEAWATFARGLDRQRYAVCFVPDTALSSDSPPAGLEDFLWLPEAAWNLGLRMALYEAAYLNLGVNSGPFFLALLNHRARAIMFVIQDESAPQTSDRFVRYQGFVPGEQPPILGPFQAWVWGADTLPAIGQAFDAMVARIEDDADALDSGGQSDCRVTS